MTQWNTYKVLFIFPNRELRKVSECNEHSQKGVTKMKASAQR